MPAYNLTQVQSKPDFLAAKRLFVEYASQLEFSLCFQNFDAELDALARTYGMPEGVLLLARSNLDEAVGVVALKRLDRETCEMKRLYVVPSERGSGLGRKLVGEIIRIGRELGYMRMRLDTIGEKMAAAVKIYREYGFDEIPPYYDNPMEGVIYMELDLHDRSGKDQD